MDSANSRRETIRTKKPGQIQMLRLQTLFFAVVIVGALSLTAVAQSRSAQSSTNNSTSQTVTGCLQQGREPGGYFLVSQKGKVWEVRSNSGMSLGDQVGKTVTLTGSTGRLPAATETRISQQEQREASVRPVGDLEVTNIQSASGSCK